MADQMRNRHNCIKEAFSVRSISGGMKMRQRSTLRHHKFLDPYHGYAEDMSTQPDSNLNFIKNISCRRVNHLPTHKIPKVVALEDNFPAEDQEFLHTSSNWVSPAPETHGDVSMETAHDFKMPVDAGSKEQSDFPTRLVRPFELSRNAETMWLTSDHSLLMEIDPSKSMGFLESPVTAALKQPTLTECEGDVTMCEQPIIKSRQVLPILERVGEKLREKLHVDLN